jgi:protein-S-isoprenylcysteine O-methyltransferase Ste14
VKTKPGAARPSETLPISLLQATSILRGKVCEINNGDEKDGAAVRIIPPLVPLLTILAGVGLNRLWPLDVAAVLPAPQRYWIGGIAVAAAFATLGAWPVVLFRKSGQSEVPWTPTSRIIAYGPYRYTRNPMYLMMVCVCVGVAVIVANIWILLLTPLCALVLHRFAILPEEAYLERKFGRDYLAYKSSVRRWF